MRFPMGGAPSRVAVADLNNDTYPDIVTRTFNDFVSVRMGYGNGKFANYTTFPVQNSYISTGHYEKGVAVADLNHDTYPDIVVTNNGYAGSISVLMGRGNGSFAPQIIFPIGTHQFPIDLAIADLNHDKNPDIVTLTKLGYIWVMMGYGNGSFAKQTTFNPGWDPYSLAIADLNHDTNLDIVVANNGDFILMDNGSVSVLMGYGNGSFSPPTTFPAMCEGVLGTVVGVAIADLNHDMNLDIVTVSENVCDVSVLIGDGNGKFALPTTFPTGCSPMAVAIADLNHDTFPDIAVSVRQHCNVSVLMGYGNGSFAPNTDLCFGSTGSCDYFEYCKQEYGSIMISDLDDDRQPDIMLSDGANGGNIAVLFGGWD